VDSKGDRIAFSNGSNRDHHEKRTFHYCNDDCELMIKQRKSQEEFNKRKFESKRGPAKYNHQSPKNRYSVNMKDAFEVFVDIERIIIKDLIILNTLIIIIILGQQVVVLFVLNSTT